MKPIVMWRRIEHQYAVTRRGGGRRGQRARGSTADAAMLLLDFENDVPLHDAPLSQQSSVAETEAKLLVNAFEGSVSVPPDCAAAALLADGVATVDGVVSDAVAIGLLSHVNTRLSQFLEAA